MGNGGAIVARSRVSGSRFDWLMLFTAVKLPPGEDD